MDSVEPMCAGYCATKAAITGLTKAMAIDHGKDGIRVNCLCPGYIDAGLAAAGPCGRPLHRQANCTLWGESDGRKRWAASPFIGRATMPRL